LRLLVLTLLLTAITLSVTSHAHTGLTSSKPLAEQVLYTAIKELRLEFSTPVRLIQVKLLDNDGNPVELIAHQRTQADTVFRIPAPQLNAGSYTFKWIVMGGDTHKMTGSIPFTVAESSAQ